MYVNIYQIRSRRFSSAFEASQEELAKDFGIQRFFRLPLSPKMSLPGLPFILRQEDSEFERLAKEALEALEELKRGQRASVRTEVQGALLIFSSEEGEWAMKAHEVLLECRSATMRDELTGERRFKEEEIPKDVVAKEGMVELGVFWGCFWTSCGHVLGITWPIKGIKGSKRWVFSMVEM